MADPAVSRIVVRGGDVVDAGGRRRADVRIADGEVVEVGADLAPGSGEQVLDAEGCVVAPGLVDLHVHLREPGREEAETVETGSRGAALGGFTAVVAMPNTEPPPDDLGIVTAVRDAAKVAGLCAVHPSGCITKGRRGEELAPIGELYDAGVRIFTDDGDCVDDAAVMRRALEYASMLPGAVIAQHAECGSLVAGGHMHEGEWSSRLGIPGRPAEAEAVVVARDIALARRARARYHVLHLSTAAAAEHVRAAQREGLAVTAEVTPQHLTLTDAACADFDPVFKVNPPLREEADLDALRSALADGTIGAVATDHAPHPAEAKEQPFEEAPPGMLGLETAVALLLTELVTPGQLTLEQALAALSWQPAAIAGLDDHGGPIAAGRPAHLCVIDPTVRWTVDPDRFASRSRNTPFAGRELTGRVRHTVFGGEAVVLDGEAQR